jgi:hypothetical protein
MGEYADEMVVACFIVFIRSGQHQSFLPSVIINLDV